MKGPYFDTFPPGSAGQSRFQNDILLVPFKRKPIGCLTEVADLEKANVEIGSFALAYWDSKPPMSTTDYKSRRLPTYCSLKAWRQCMALRRHRVQMLGRKPWPNYGPRKRLPPHQLSLRRSGDPGRTCTPKRQVPC